MIKAFFILTWAGVTLSGASSIVQIDALAVLSKLAWVVISVSLVIFGNRYFKNRDDERTAQKKVFEKIDARMALFEEGLQEFKETILQQNANYNGLMAKLEGTTDILSEVHQDVKEHEKIINRLQGLLKNDIGHGKGR